MSIKPLFRATFITITDKQARYERKGKEKAIEKNTGKKYDKNFKIIFQNLLFFLYS